MDLRKHPDHLADRLEACRPDSTDIAREELREAAAALSADADLAQQFERQQQSDALVSQAMRQVAAPAGLADRLLARLAQADAAPAATDQEVAAPLALDQEFAASEAAASEPVPAASTESTVEPASPQPSHGLSRGKLLSAVTTLAASLLLAIVGYQWWSGPGLVDSPKGFQDQATRWRVAVENSDRWKADSAGYTSLLKRYPLHHMKGHVSGYQTIDPQLPDAAELIVYDFSLPRAKAYLFVAQTQYTSSNLSADGFPPSQSQPLSAGWRLAAWREDTLLYVLLHQGGPHQYNDLVDNPGAIAWIEPSQERWLALASDP